MVFIETPVFTRQVRVAAQAEVRLLLIYRKGVKDDVTAAEKRTLRRLNEDW
ncbi:MAG TPA: hypothetical protein VMT66_09720 [Steroidobacteraceae bacterium]|nr:hypothetical protein [Steroidobacteraceae bacterium]